MSQPLSVQYAAMSGNTYAPAASSGPHWKSWVPPDTGGQLPKSSLACMVSTIEPSVGIGQRGLLVQTPAGNLLWDPNGYLDDDPVAAVRQLGGLAAVAASHPHMFGVQVEWSHRFGNVPVYVQAADREWLQRDDWEWWQPGMRKREVLPGVMPTASAATSWQRWSFTSWGLTAEGFAERRHRCRYAGRALGPSFMRSFPNKIPLSAAVVAKVADRVLDLDFDRLYDNFGGQVLSDAAGWVRRSADRYIAWFEDFDHLTG